MTYAITPADMASITDPEMAFSTDRLLPALSDIPPEFFAGNIYTELVSAIFFGLELPEMEMELKDGFDPQALNRAVRAHLQSWGPRHQHKIAGVGFMIAQAAVLQSIAKKDPE